MFRKFVAKLMLFQKELDRSYINGEFLRDRLVTAANIISVNSAIQDSTNHTAEQLKNGIVN